MKRCFATALIVTTAIVSAARGGPQVKDRPLGSMAPWSFAVWFGECHAPLRVNELAITFEIACSERVGVPTWAINVHYKGAISSLEVSGETRAELRQVFSRRVPALTRPSIASLLEGSIDSDSSKVFGQEISIIRLSTPGDRTGVVRAVEDITWTTSLFDP